MPSAERISKKNSATTIATALTKFTMVSLAVLRRGARSANAQNTSTNNSVIKSERSAPSKWTNNCGVCPWFFDSSQEWAHAQRQLARFRFCTSSLVPSFGVATQWCVCKQRFCEMSLGHLVTWIGRSCGLQLFLLATNERNLLKFVMVYVVEISPFFEGSSLSLTRSLHLSPFLLLAIEQSGWTPNVTIRKSSSRQISWNKAEWWLCKLLFHSLMFWSHIACALQGS